MTLLTTAKGESQYLSILFFKKETLRITKPAPKTFVIVVVINSIGQKLSTAKKSRLECLRNVAKNYGRP